MEGLKRSERASKQMDDLDDVVFLEDLVELVADVPVEERIDRVPNQHPQHQRTFINHNGTLYTCRAEMQR